TGAALQRADVSQSSDFTWEVKANDRAYHTQFKKRVAFCLTRKKYEDNAIKTAKYNVLTFLPLNLYEQFHRLANLYFLFVILLQTVPEISTLPWFTLLLPLSFLLLLRGLRDLIDDIVKVSRAVSSAHLRHAGLLSGLFFSCSFSWKKWRDICVGDIVCLRKDSFVPADLLLLSSSEPSSLCYVETADIDGETNLKFRQALLATHQELVSEASMAAFDGKVTCEEPNSRMHSFIGTLEWRGEKYSLDSEKILLRGCRIRNTETCYGLVIYAGLDSKIMKNCGKIKMKKTKLDRLMDRLVILVSASLPPETGWPAEPALPDCPLPRGVALSLAQHGVEGRCGTGVGSVLSGGLRGAVQTQVGHCHLKAARGDELGASQSGS
uniref:ATPase phospholipid transporting 8B3 n=1 Tax=Chrysemys picta bellii TaxID=8478 RepID=A0A8C3HZH1_CHRPI